MRILDNDSNKKVDDITILLKYSEAKELKDTLEQLLNSVTKLNHGHVNDETFSKEITIALYDDNQLNGLNERCKKLILEDL